MKLEDMTLEEKRELLGDFCDGHWDCNVCPCDSDDDAWCKKYNHYNIPESDTDEAIKKYYIPYYTNNPYWYKITAIANRQRMKGLRDYGQGIEDNPAHILDRLSYIEEELVDALMYLEWLKDGIQNGKK